MGCGKWLAAALAASSCAVAVDPAPAIAEAAAVAAAAPAGPKLGTKILLTTEGRSGSTFVGQVLNLHPSVMYLYEPCRALKFRGAQYDTFNTWLAISACTKLTRALFDCAFTPSELAMLLQDKTAVSKSRVLRQVAANFTKMKEAHNGGNSGGSRRVLAAWKREEWKKNKEAGGGASSTGGVGDKLNVDSPALQMAHAHAVGVCKQSFRVIKEIRFARGVPDNLLYSEVKVLHLVRDPRAVLYSRLALEAFCGETAKSSTTSGGRRLLSSQAGGESSSSVSISGSVSGARACVQPMCQGYRATLRGIATYLATLEGRPYWQFYKFKRVKFEEVALDPLPWTQRIYTWANLGTVSPSIASWVKENTEAKRADGPYSTRRDASEVVDKWRGGKAKGEPGLTASVVREINQECGDILHQLNYSEPQELLPKWQTTPGSSVGGRVVARQDASILSAYPRDLMHARWNAYCGRLSEPLPGYAGRGGHTDECQLLGTMAFDACQAALEKSQACSSLSHHGGKCFLHDRTAADYLSFPQAQSKHVVKMLSGVDECLVYDAPLHHARRYYYTAELQATVPWVRKFYMYDAPAFNYSALVTCYVAEFGIEPWLDERRHEMAQNTASMWLHESFKRHPLRTLDPNEADLFVMPIEAYVSASLNKPCKTPAPAKVGETPEGVHPDGLGGTVQVVYTESTAESRNADLLQFLQASPFWKKHGGRDHLVICAWWGAAKSWGKWKTDRPTLWKLMRPSAILATIDEYFARDWNKVLVVPYVAHALMTRWRKEPLPANREIAQGRRSKRTGSVAAAATSTGGGAGAAVGGESAESSSSIGSSGGDSSTAQSWQKKSSWKKKSGGEYGANATFSGQLELPASSEVKDSIFAAAAAAAGEGEVTYGAQENPGASGIKNQTTELGVLAAEESTLKGRDAAEPAVLTTSPGSGARRRLAAWQDQDDDTEAGPDLSRNVTFFFRGGMLHGVDCKRKGTWVRRAAFEAFSEIPHARITATEDLSKFSDEQTGLIDPSITERQRRQARVPNYSSHQYVRELREAQYCLHLRGDTSTSRRIYDALAAGCVPVIISDDSHLPFKSQIDWDSFTVSINEDELIEHKSRVPQALIENPALLRQKQAALRQAQEDLLYGYGSPFDPPSPRFKSNVASHLLQQAFELVPVVGRYRRFPDTFSACTFVQTLWPE